MKVHTECEKKEWKPEQKFEMKQTYNKERRKRKRAISLNITFDRIESVHNALTQFSISTECTQNTHSHFCKYFVGRVGTQTHWFSVQMEIGYVSCVRHKWKCVVQWRRLFSYSNLYTARSKCDCNNKKHWRERKKIKTGNSIPLSMSFELVCI